MHPALKQWLTAHTATPGLLGCGVLGPGQAPFCPGTDESCPPEKIAALLNHFSTMNAAGIHASPGPCWNTWIFDHGQIRYVLRPDNWLLVLIVQADTEAVTKLNDLAAGFLLLNF